MIVPKTVFMNRRGHAGRIAFCIPAFLPQRGWSAHSRGYRIYTSRKVQCKLKRGHFLHRAIVEHFLGGAIPSGLQVQHLWPFLKTCGCPERLLLAPPEFNPSPARRDPYTGQFLRLDEWQRRYGVDWSAA